MFKIGDRVRLVRGQYLYQLKRWDPDGTAIVTELWANYIWVQCRNGYHQCYPPSDLEHAERILDKWITENGEQVPFKDMSKKNLKEIIKLLTDDKNNWQRHKLVSLEKELAKREKNG